MIRDEKSHRPDEELARLAADGDAAAFDEIYSRHRRFVYNVAVRMIGNQADAEDLTQESFVTVLRRVGSFRGDALFTTWLYRLVSNQVKMHFRYRSSRPETQISDGEIPERWPGARRTDPAEQLMIGSQSRRQSGCSRLVTNRHSSCTTSKVTSTRRPRGCPGTRPALRSRSYIKREPT